MSGRTSHLADVRLYQTIYKLSLEDEEVDNDLQPSGNNKLHTAVLLNDTDSFEREVTNINLNDTNVKGETPLHIAAKNKSEHGFHFLVKLISEGSDVNARNKWHQTPLHYAAIVESKDNIEALVQVPNTDVNAKDVNGYNALLALIAASSGADPNDASLSSDLQEAIRILVRAGVEVNNQTKCGNGILHLAADRKDNTPLLSFLIFNVAKKIDLGLKNKMKENFLHVYAISEIHEEVIKIFDNIAVKCLTTLKDLLNQPNVLGRTPWENMIDELNVSKEAMQKVLGYGVVVRRTDNYGNTVLHRLAGVSTGMGYCDVLETVIQGGADVNATNVFGESAASVLFLEPVLDVLMKYNLKCNTFDRWHRSTLINIMKHHPIPDFLKALIEKDRTVVNASDMFGSTPLHFAAYHNFPEQVELLLKYGADVNAKDNLGDTPFDTVTRHCSFRCHEILRRYEDSVLYSRNKSFENTLLELPKTITASIIKTPENVQSFLGLSQDLDQFMENLMNTYCNRRPEYSAEVKEVVKEINSLVLSLCTQIAQYDSRFKMSIFPTGSSAEETKVGRPDEFDFVLCLDELNDITETVMTKACKKTGFVCLKFKDYPVSEQFLPFSDMDGYFLALPFLQYFTRYLRRGMSETDLWKTGKLCYTFEDKMEVINGKPVFNFNVYWVGSVFKQLKISIDLVPAVYKKGWWPPNINVDNIPLMNEHIKSEGCFLILQTKSHDFEKEKNRQMMRDGISQTCNNNLDEHNYIMQRMLRISAAPAEICLIKSMPTNFRNAYELAKIIKTKDVCPEIEIDKLSTTKLTWQMKFTRSILVKPSNQIKSYMLKNCAFYILQEMKSKLRENHSNIRSQRIMCQMYQYLLEFADKQQMSPYFLPYSDVFEFEKEKNRTSYNNFLIRLKRELSIKLVLGICNYPFPEEWLASSFN